MASTDIYHVHTVYTEEGYGGSYEMAVYCKVAAAQADYTKATSRDPLVCDHCDEIVLGGDTFQPFAAEDDNGHGGYIACLPCYVQGTINGGVEMIISGKAFEDSVPGKHAAA